MLAPTWNGHCNTPLDRTCAYLEVAGQSLTDGELLDVADMLHDLIRSRRRDPVAPEERTFAPSMR